MNEPDLADTDTFETAPIAAEDALIIEVDGFEGPLDLLLALARSQKVDIAKISVLKLAEQYLAFMETARHHRLELAADYLVMAAWLTFLKSRLVLPQPAGPEAAGAEEMAAQLRWRLTRLQMMRDASVRLLARDRLGRDVFARGAPEPVEVVRTRKHADTMYDLLTAYSQQRVRKLGHRVYEMTRVPVYLIEEARMRIERMLGHIPSWSALTRFMPLDWGTGVRRRSALASTFSAALELTRDGKLEMRQMSVFGEIFLKDHVTPAAGEGTT
ncbi:MAG TPA: ScpA family protein [Micropepsaceae bacterium]|jgi:segregation and condensation protein A|nr:ScpA family protein [Micropepsaceae bacterium]